MGGMSSSLERPYEIKIFLILVCVEPDDERIYLLFFIAQEDQVIYIVSHTVFDVHQLIIHTFLKTVLSVFDVSVLKTKVIVF
jgi:hypothetical protein